MSGELKGRIHNTVKDYMSVMDNFEVIGMGEFQATIDGVKDSARRFAYEHGGIDLLVVDYIQALGRVETSQKQEEIFTRVGNIMNGLTELTDELNCGTLALSQLNRDSRKLNKMPRKEDFMGSSEIEFNAHIMSVLWREKDDTEYLKDGLEIYPTWWKAVKSRLVRPFCTQIGFKSSNQQYVGLALPAHKYDRKDAYADTD